MIRVVKLDGTPIVLNADWIQSVENTPDTLITLTTGTKFIVQDRLEDVVDSVLEYKRGTRNIHPPEEQP